MQPWICFHATQVLLLYRKPHSTLSFRPRQNRTSGVWRGGSSLQQLSGCRPTWGVFFLQGFPPAQGSLTPQRWLQLFPHYICQLHSTRLALLCATHTTHAGWKTKLEKGREEHRLMHTEKTLNKNKEAEAEAHTHKQTHVFVLLHLCGFNSSIFEQLAHLWISARMQFNFY